MIQRRCKGLLTGVLWEDIDEALVACEAGRVEVEERENSLVVWGVWEDSSAGLKRNMGESSAKLTGVGARGNRVLS